MSGFEEQPSPASSLNLAAGCHCCLEHGHIQACLRRLKADGHPLEDEDNDVFSERALPATKTTG
jgi:hypothetical protein